MTRHYPEFPAPGGDFPPFSPEGIADLGPRDYQTLHAKYVAWLVYLISDEARVTSELVAAERLLTESKAYNRQSQVQSSTKDILRCKELLLRVDASKRAVEEIVRFMSRYVESRKIDAQMSRSGP
jgi:hypothetical protein